MNVIARILMPAAIATALLATAACHPKGDVSRLAVAVSIPPQAALLQAIAGDSVDVVTLMTSDANPETFEMSVADFRRVAGASAFLKTGTIPLEDVLLEKIGHSAPNMRIYDTSEGIDFVYGTHDHCEHHHAHHSHHDDNDSDGHDDDDDDDEHGHTADPHVWTSIANMRVIAHNMLDALVEIDPANNDYYTTNYQSLIATLDSADNAIAERLRPFAGTSFMVWHPSLSYFARDYNLEQIAIGQENKEMSVLQLRNTLLHAAEAEVSALFMQPNIDSERAAGIARQIGAHPVAINTLSPNWQQQFNIIVNAITNGSK